MNKISIIILNWNGWKDTIECLESLYRIEYQNYEVILVDNFSTDNSIEKIKAWTKWDIEVESKYFDKTKCTHDLKIYEYTKNDLINENYKTYKKEFDKLPSNKKLFLLKNDKNYWFAWWNNIAIKQVLSEKTSDYILLLNNDTVVNKKFLNQLMNCLFQNQNKNIACIWPKILNYYNNKIIDSLSILISPRWGWVDEWNWENDNCIEDKLVFWISGCCFLINNDSLNELVNKTSYIFDEDYFLYYEDVDLAWRLNLLWYQSYLCSNSVIYHKWSASSWKFSTLKSFYIMRNRLYIIFKFYWIFKIIESIFYIWKSYFKKLIVIIWLKNNSWHVEKIMKKNNKWLIIQTFIKSYASFLLNLPKILHKRINIKKNTVISKKEYKNLFKKYESTDKNS